MKIGRDIAKDWSDMLNSGRGQDRPALYNRASSIGHPCLRSLYLDRVGASRKPLDEAVLGIFALGHELERICVSRLMSRGYVIERSQEPLQLCIDGRVMWSGHPDGLLHHVHDTSPIPVVVDVKSMNSHIWGEIPDDPTAAARFLDEAKQPWLRKYTPQIRAYLACYHDMRVKVDGGVLLFVNKDTFQVKVARVEREEEAEQALISKARLINEAFADDEMPAPCGDSDVCERCGYSQVSCFPEIAVKATGIVDIEATENQIVVDSLRVWVARRAAQKEADAAQTRVKTAFKAMAPGEYLVEGIGSVRVTEDKNGRRTVKVVPSAE